MAKTLLIFLVLGLALQFISCANLRINSAVGYDGKTYAFDGYPFIDGDETTPHAYEVVDGQITNTYTLSGTTGSLPISVFVDGATLYQFSGAYGTAFLNKYTLPLTSASTADATLTLDSHLMIPAKIDTTDKIALAIVTRNLNLIDLNTMTVLSTYRAVVGSRKFPGSLVYNHDTDMAYFFITNYCSWGYCQHIQEYTTTGGVLTQLDESFTPDFNTEFNTGVITGCDMDYSTSSIWCYNSETAQLIKFDINNLNSYSFISLPAGDYSDDNVAYDFASQKAYVISDGVTDFGVAIISLADGSVINSASINGDPVVSVSLDITQGKLFLGHDNVDTAPTMTIVNIADLSSTTISF